MFPSFTPASMRLLRHIRFLFFPLCTVSLYKRKIKYDTRKIKNLLLTTELNRDVTVKGWVRSARGNKYVQFISLNDGSTIKNIQVVADVAKFSEELLKLITTGACIAATGTLVASQGKGQAQEIQATTLEILGECDPEMYPLQKRGQDSKDKKPVTLPLEFLREKAHLRPRTNTFGAVLRIRHHMSFGIHKFLMTEGFLIYIAQSLPVLMRKVRENYFVLRRLI